MLKYNKFVLSKEFKGDFSYCIKCKQFLCGLCELNHKNEDKPHIIIYKKYDSLCKMHANLYCFYFIIYKKNLYVYYKQ